MTTPTDAIKRADLESCARIYVAFSGGVDSSALLHATVQVYGPERVTALHVNHGLSAHAAQWQAHCEAVAVNLGIDIECLTVSVGAGNVELQARRARYSAWASILAADDVLLLGHHQGDVAETRLWQLFTGRVPAGIPQERRMGLGRLVRPLLALERAELVAYVDQHAMKAIQDPSNADLSFDRNWLRNDLLPRIEGRFPNAARNIAKANWGELPVVSRGPLPVDSVDEARLRGWLGSYQIVPRQTAVREILSQRYARSDAMPMIYVAPGISVRRYRDRWYVVRDVTPPGTRTARVGDAIVWAGGELSWRAGGQGLVAGQPIGIRARQAGDRIVVRGKYKSISRCFQARGIPPWLRDLWPILTHEEGIAAVPGIAIADGQGGKMLPNWSTSIELG